MLKQVIAGIGLLIMASCHPVYATEANVITDKHCAMVKAAARQLLIDIQQGATQYEVMNAINKRDFNEADYPAKVYLQLSVNDFVKNIHRGFRVQQVLAQVQASCDKMVGFSF